MPLPTTTVDPYRPNPARIYDYALGGGANFAADRAAAEAMAALYPDGLLAARANRAFLGRAVTVLARQGVARFLDIGSGLPTAGNVHEVARRVNAKARVVYVDNDPVAVRYSERLLEEEGPSDGVAAIEADLCDPASILAHDEVRRLLAAHRPVGLILAAVLHFLPDDTEARRVVATLAGSLPKGSYVVISHGTTEVDAPDVLAQLVRLYEKTTHPLGFRSRAQLAPFFDGFALMDPGIVFAPAWRPDDPCAPFADEPARAAILCGVGRKG